MTARVFLAVVGWAGTIVIARTLTPSGWGALTFVFGILGMIGLVADLQVAKLVLRDVMTAGDSAGSVVGTYLLMRLALGVASFAIAIGFVVASGYEDQILWTTFVGGFEFLLTPPAFALLVWFQSRLWLRPVAAGLVAGGCFQLGTVLAIASLTDGSPAGFAVAYVVGDVVWLAWELVALRRARLHLRLSVDLRRWGVWLKEAVPLAIGFGLFSVYYKLDLVMLGQLDTLESVGQYSIGYKFADVTAFVPLALLTPVLTLLVSAWPHDSEAAREHFRRAAMLLAVAAVGIGVGFALVAQPLVELLYGTRFAESVDAARLLVIGASIQFFSQLCFVALVALGRNWPYVVAALSGVVLNVVLNLVLIPQYSFNGSAVATVITEVVVLVLMLIALRKTPEVMAIPWTALASTASAGLIMIVIYLGAVRFVAWPVAAGAAALGFLGFLQAVRIDGHRGLRTLWEYLRFEHAYPLEAPTAAVPDT